MSIYRIHIAYYIGLAKLRFQHKIHDGFDSIGFCYSIEPTETLVYQSKYNVVR